MKIILTNTNIIAKVATPGLKIMQSIEHCFMQGTEVLPLESGNWTLHIIYNSADSDITVNISGVCNGYTSSRVAILSNDCPTAIGDTCSLILPEYRYEKNEEFNTNITIPSKKYLLLDGYGIANHSCTVTCNSEEILKYTH